MKNIIIGFVLGIAVASIGFSGITRLLDKGVELIKNQSTDLAK